MEKKFFRINAELDTNIGFEKIPAALKKLGRWLLPIPLILSAAHPIINFGVVNTNPSEKPINVETQRPTPEKQPKLSKKKIPPSKKKEKCSCG